MKQDAVDELLYALEAIRDVISKYEKFGIPVVDKMGKEILEIIEETEG